MSACDYFLWGYLKGKVYATRPRNIEELKARIREEISNIPEDMLHRAMQSLRIRCEECVRKNKGHLDEVIFKK
jgi:hypothetical protein